MVRRLLALMLFAVPALAQSPTCGELVTTSFGSITPVYNWSTKQPSISLTVDSAGGSVTRSGDNVTYTTTTNPQTAGIIVGSCIKVRGVTDSNFNAGGDYALTSAIRGAGAQVDFIISTADLAPLPAGVTVDVVEVSNLNLSGAYTVLASPAPTALTFSANTVETGVLSTTGGEVAFCLRVTAVDSTSITVSLPGGGTTSANGTVTSARETRPMQGSTIRDYNFGADCDVENFFDGRNHATGNGYDVFVHYPSVFSCNPAFTKCFFPANTSTFHLNVSDRSIIRNTAGGMGSHWDWARAGDPNASDNKLYRVSGCNIQTYDIDDASTGTVFNFAGCTSIGIGSGEGGGTGKEGQGRIYGVTNTTVLPVVDETAGVKRFHVWQSNGASTGTLLISVTAESGVSYDNAKLFPVSGNMVIRTSNDGPTITSWTCSSGTVTMNHTSTTVRGTQIRVIRAPQAGVNGLFTHTVVSPTQLTYALSGACPAASGGSGGYIGHLGGGFLYYKISDGGTLSNIIDGDVSHFDTGRDIQGDDVLIVHSSPMGTLTGCAGGAPLVMVEADASKFTNEATSTAAYVASACTAWDGAFASGQDGWAALSGKINSAACHRNENNIVAACTTAPKSNNIIFLAKLDHSADMAETYRMVFDRQPESEDQRAQLSDDCAEILWMTRWREGASANAPNMIARVSTGLSACTGGGAAAPTLTAVSPDNGDQGTTPAMTLTGTNLDGANLVVAVSGADVTPNGCAADNATQISCTNFTIGAAAATGNRNVTATTDDGTSNAVIFTVNASGAPTLSGVSPSSGVQGRSYVVTLTGTNFDPSATIAVSGSGVSNVVNFVSATTIVATFTINVSAATGVRTVTVTTGAGSSGTQNFTVVVKPSTGFGIGVPTDFMMF